MMDIQLNHTWDMLPYQTPEQFKGMTVEQVEGYHQEQLGLLIVAETQMWRLKQHIQALEAAEQKPWYRRVIDWIRK